jgi:hypothetical protein
MLKMVDRSRAIRYYSRFLIRISDLLEKGNKLSIYKLECRQTTDPNAFAARDRVITRGTLNKPD